MIIIEIVLSGWIIFGTLIQKLNWRGLTLNDVIRVSVVYDAILLLSLLIFAGVWFLVGDGGIISPSVGVDLFVVVLLVVTFLLKNS